MYLKASSEGVYDEPTPPPITFAYRNITPSSSPYGTAVAVPTFTQAGDTLLFVASRMYDHGFTIEAPAGAVAVAGTPENLAGDFPSFAAWWIAAWDGVTTTYDFGFDGWAGERAIVSFTGEASAITSGALTDAAAVSAIPWAAVTLGVGEIAVGVGGVHDISDLPVTGLDPAWTQRKAQGTGEWVGFGLWTHQAATAGVVATSPGGTMASSGNASSQILKVVG